MAENKPIRVAQVIGMAIDGGTESVFMNYYRQIDRSQVQFDFLVESESTIISKKEIEAMGGRVVFIPHYSHLFSYIRSLKKIFREGGYDIVHSNMNTLSVFPLYAAKCAGIPVRIAHSHSATNPQEKKRNLLKLLLRPFSKLYATHYFACSEYAGRWLFGDRTFDEGKVTVIYNAVDLERFRFDPEKRAEVRKKLGIGDGLVVGNIGRFVETKNQAFLLDLFAEVVKKRNDARLLLLGDGPLKDMLVEKAEKLEIKDRVLFEGITKYPEDYYNAMDCFVLPSLYEGLGMVLIEAQINGLNCLASDNVPQEANIGSVKFKSLADKDWCDSIEPKRNETGAYTENYDIKIQSPRLQSLYLEMLGLK